MDQIKPHRGLIPLSWMQLNPVFKGLTMCHMFLEGHGGVTEDLIRDNPTAAFVADTAWATNEYGSCVAMDGTDDLIDTNVQEADFGNCTVVSWASMATDFSMYLIGNATFGNDRFLLSRASRSQIGFDCWSNDGSNVFLEVFDLAGDDKIHMMGATSSPIETALYFDSKQVDSDVAVPSGTGAGYDWVIGAKYPTLGDKWNGNISTVLIWNRGLTEAEMAEVYKLGPGLGLGSKTDRFVGPFFGLPAGSTFNASFTTNSNQIL